MRGRDEDEDWMWMWMEMTAREREGRDADREKGARGNRDEEGKKRTCNRRLGEPLYAHPE